MADSAVKVGLVNPKRRIGLFGATAFSIGCMIGSGIFISPKGALEHGQSIGVTLIMWALAGLITLIHTVVYGELAVRVPLSGGDFSYIYKGIGQVPAFLTAWIMPIFVKASTSAVLSLVFADYLLVYIFPDCPAPDQMRKLIGAVQVLTICVSNIASVKFGVYVQIVCSYIKTAALLVITIGGVVYLANGNTANLQSPFVGSATDVTSYCLSLYSCMFAYSGYVNVNEITEEVKDAEKNVPRAIVASIVCVCGIYITANISYFALIPKIEFLQSMAVAYEWAVKAMPSVAVLVPPAVMCSVYGTNCGISISTGRILFAAARKGMFPEAVSFLHTGQSHPIVGIIIYHVVCLIMLIPGDIAQLINFLSFMHFTVILLSCVSLIRMKLQVQHASDAVEKKHFTSHITVPIAGVLLSTFLIIAPFLKNPRVEFLYGVGFVLCVLLLYVPFVHFQLRVPGMDHITVFLQLLCNVCPTAKHD